MTKILATFSGSRYHDTTRKIVEDGPRLGCDRVLVFDDVWLKTKRPEFCESVKWAFNHPKNRGVCWFCWKPLVLIDALRRSPEGSSVLFVDADCWPISDMTPLYELCERDDMALFAACGHSQRHWSKRDAQIRMGMGEDRWRDRQAGVARFMLFKNNGGYHHVSVNEFLKEWLYYTCDPLVNTFDKSILAEEYPDLKEARAEQAVLTNLAHKYDITLHREADQWGNDFKADFPNDTYGQIFESTGVYSYDPNGCREGSAFRNVHD